MLRFLFIPFLVAMTCTVKGQSVIVNPDGTHTVVIDSGPAGSPKIIVHPNGGHSVVHTAGGHSIAVGPDGRHTVLIGFDQPGSPKIIVHPNGKHSVVHSTGPHSVLIDPDGNHKVIANQILPLWQANRSVNAQGQLPAAFYSQLEMLMILCLIK